MQKKYWIELSFRDEFNEPLSWVSGNLVAGNGEKYPFMLFDEPVVVKDLTAGRYTIELDFDSWVPLVQSRKSRQAGAPSNVEQAWEGAVGVKNNPVNYIFATAGDFLNIEEEEQKLSEQDKQQNPNKIEQFYAFDDHQKGALGSFTIQTNQSYVFEIKGFDAQSEKEKFLVETIGLSHGAEQDFEFYDLTDMTQKSAIESRKVTDKTTQSSTIYSWDWKPEVDNANVWLKIDSDEAPIKVPLFYDVSSTPERSDKQDFQVCAFLPFTHLPSFDREKTPQDCIALSRPGFVYLTYGGKFWREIEISTDEKGEMIYRDVHLYQYREGRDKPFRLKERREATGKPIKEIWYPSREAGQPTDVRIAFSEVQWSAARLNYLENDTSELEQRLKPPRFIEEALDTMPEMRARQTDLEYLLPDPSLLVYDLSGKWFQDRYNTIEQNLEKSLDDGWFANKQFREETNPFYVERLELYFKYQAIMYLNRKAGYVESEEGTERPDFSIPSSQDVLQDAKSRKLKGILLSDPLFGLRQHTYLINYASLFLMAVSENATHQPHFRSAELVQSFIMQEKFGNEPNQYYKYRNALNTSFSKKYSRTLREAERLSARMAIEDIKTKLEPLLEQDDFYHAARDVNSGDNQDPTLVHVLAGRVLSALSLHSRGIDKIGMPNEDFGNPYIERVERILRNDGSHKLHRVLFPELDEIVEIKGEGDERIVHLKPCVKGIAPYNDGSGFTTLALIAQWADENLLLNIENIKSEELKDALTGEMMGMDNEQGWYSSIRRVVGAINGVFQGYFESLNAVTASMIGTQNTSFLINAYMSPLAMLKHGAPPVFGHINVYEAGQHQLSGVVVGTAEIDAKGAHTQQWGTLQGKRMESQSPTHVSKEVYQEFEDKQKLILASKKRTLKKIAHQNTKSFHPIKKTWLINVAPEDSKLAKMAQDPSYNRAFKELESEGIAGTKLSNTYYKLRLPYAITAIEVFNLQANAEHFKKLRSSDLSLYNVLSAASAALDFAITLGHSANLFMGQNAQTLQWMNTTHKTPKLLVDKLGIAKELSRLSIVGWAAGLLTSGLAMRDSLVSFSENDHDAGVAMGMVAIGSAISSFAALGAKGTLLAALGLWGVGLAFFGGIFYVWLKDSEMERWLKNGPFSDFPAGSLMQLQDSDIGYRHLVNLLLNFGVNLSTLERFIDNSDIEIPQEALSQIHSSGSTHVIYLRSNLHHILNTDLINESLYIRESALQEIREVDSGNLYASPKFFPLSSENMAVQYEHKVLDGKLYFVTFTKPVPQTKQQVIPQTYKMHEFSYQRAITVRAQLTVDEHSFPLPPMDKPIDSPVRGIPHFDDDDIGWLQSSSVGI
ncbi:hypothetical protein INR79_14945 [Vibrio sp. SCSIO 43132]|uniref:hypothetical protein n=1 Tax=Vibrio sp. SCSIO 43132 TaxID=2779363 RepID=UPI001CAA03EB|nr:hypothetical protein [Vibrio sp. SCSIO 43132]UAB69797.1 hypothetical protein INR79_14945 [Vibrio sp. SCSIO 43132]